jgi:hypothetical protein
MSISEIHALLALMDDPDETVYTHVRERLLSKGKEVIPFVDSVASSGQNDALINGRLALLKEGLQQTDVKEALRAWMDEGGMDLWKGVELVHSAVDSSWNVAQSNGLFEALKKEIWLELNEEQTALEQVRILNHVFFSLHNMESVRRLPHVPMEALPSGVLQEKKGNPIGLGVLYLAVAQSLGIPLRGVNLPNHFILAYCDVAHVDDPLATKGQSGILFYINPYSHGSVIGVDDVSEFLVGVGEGDSVHQWRPSHPMEIIQRLVRNVAFATREASGEERSKRFLDLFEPLLSAFENTQQRSGDYPPIRE